MLSLDILKHSTTPFFSIHTLTLIASYLAVIFFLTENFKMQWQLREIWIKKFLGEFLCVLELTDYKSTGMTLALLLFSAPVANVTIYLTKYGGTEMSSALHSWQHWVSSRLFIWLCMYLTIWYIIPYIQVFSCVTNFAKMWKMCIIFNLCFFLPFPKILIEKK